MHEISKIMKIGGSFAMIIPGNMMKEMRLERDTKLFIQYYAGKATIERFDDVIKLRNAKEQWDKEKGG